MAGLGRLYAWWSLRHCANAVAVWLNDNPKRLLCSIDESGGYDFLLKKGA